MADSAVPELRTFTVTETVEYTVEGYDPHDALNRWQLARSSASERHTFDHYQVDLYVSGGA